MAVELLDDEMRAQPVSCRHPPSIRRETAERRHDFPL
jgi:hypothetical protein